VVLRKDVAIERRLGSADHHAVLCGLVRADLRVRLRQGRRAVEDAAADPVDRDQFLGALARPHRSAGVARRCARCWRRRRVRRCKWQTVSMLALLGLAELLLVPLVALLFQAAFQPAAAAGGAAGGRHDQLLRGEDAVRHAGAGKGRATCCCPFCCIIVIPVIIASVRGTAALLSVTPGRWRYVIGVLRAFDVVFVTLAPGHSKPSHGE
jgi:hypothetical protein